MIDINREDFYLYKQPELVERTKQRLTQLSELDLEEVGTAEFGIRGKLSGLYIERVWRDNEIQWNGEIEWINRVLLK